MKMPKIKAQTRFLLPFILLLLSPAQVLYSSPKEENLVRPKLVSANPSIQAGKPFSLGVYFQISKGWHIYWLNPGDSGLPTSIEWAFPKGFQAGDLNWPIPEKFDTAGSTSFGYEKEVLLFTQVTPPADITSPTKIPLQAKVKWLACKEICIPGNSHLRLELSVSNEVSKENTRWQKEFQRVKNHLPIQLDSWNITAHREKEKIMLKLTSSSKLKRAQYTFFPLEEEIIDPSAPQKIQQTQNQILIQLKPSPYLDKSLTRLRGVLVSSRAWHSESNNQGLIIDIPVKN